MARGRMVNKKISVSYRVNKLPGDAPLLYVFLIAHLDCEGRYFGDSSIIKGQILPLRKGNAKKIDEWLDLMEQSFDDETHLPLLFRYEVGGNKYLEMPGFSDEQVGLRKDKEMPEYPPPPLEILQKIYSNSNEIQQKLKEFSQYSDEILTKNRKNIKDSDEKSQNSEHDSETNLQRNQHNLNGISNKSGTNAPDNDGNNTETIRQKYGNDTETIRQKCPLTRTGREVEQEEEVEGNTTSSSNSESSSWDSVLNPDIRKKYSSEIGEITPEVERKLLELSKKHSAPTVLEAINSCVVHDKRNLAYLIGTLNKMHSGNNKNKDDPDRFFKGKYGKRVQR